MTTLEYTELRSVDVNHILEFHKQDPTFYTVKELLEKAWGYGYNTGQPVGEVNEDGE